MRPHNIPLIGLVTEFTNNIGIEAIRKAENFDFRRKPALSKRERIEPRLLASKVNAITTGLDAS